MRKATEAGPVMLDELRQMATTRFGDMVRPSWTSCVG